jgi:deazaflavin-dependent oxidoreductase (nitroreductase family)
MRWSLILSNSDPRADFGATVLPVMAKSTINGIPRVDLVTRPQWKRDLNWLLGGRLLADTETGRAIWRRFVVPIEVPLMKATRGRVRVSFSAPIVTLVTTGARSGQQRESALTYFTDGDDVILIASNYGGARHPAWYHNLLATPECELRAGAGSGRFIARQTQGADRDRLYSLAAERLNKVFNSYVERTAGGRDIPVLRLSPAL